MKRDLVFVFCLLWISTSPVVAQADGEIVSGGGGAALVTSGGSNASASTTVETDEFTGTVTYSIDVPVPPARGGVRPNLNLNYNNMRRNPDSWVGYGWELEVGSIVRVPSGEGFIDYLGGQHFEIRRGGQSESLRFRWNLNGGAHGLPGDYGIVLREGQIAEYYQVQTEGSFSHFIHIRGNAPRYDDGGWVVIDKGGTRYEFGVNLGTSNRNRETPRPIPYPPSPGEVRDPTDPYRISRWFLERATDPNGNEMIVSYDANHYPSRISYQDIVINFVTHESLDDTGFGIFPSFRDSFPRNQNTIEALDRIRVHQGTRLLQEILLTYEASQYRHVRQLRVVQQFSGDGSSLPATHFDYFGEGELSFSPTYERNAARGSESAFRLLDGRVGEEMTMVDMNGDALVDQVAANGDGSFEVYFNNGNNFVPVTEWRRSHWEDPFMRIASSRYDDPPWRGRLNSYRGGHQWLFLIDMNGDSLPDRVVRELINPVDRGTPREAANFLIAFNNGHGWDTPVEWRDPFVGGWAGTSDQYKAFIDMNGDGLVDRVVSDRAPDSVTIDGSIPSSSSIRNRGNYLVFYNTGEGFSRDYVLWKDPVTQYSTDESSRALIYESNSHGTYSFIRDINGDGLPDRIRKTDRIFEGEREIGAGFAIFLNTGKQWAIPQKDTTRDRTVYLDGFNTFGIVDPIEDEDRRGTIGKEDDLIDVNGDGFADRVEARESVCDLRIYFYQGMSRNSEHEIRFFAQLSNPVSLPDPIREDTALTGESCGFVTNQTNEENPKQFLFFQDFNGDGFPDRAAFRRNPDNELRSTYEVHHLRINPLPLSDVPSWWNDRTINQPIGYLKEVRDDAGGKSAMEYLPSAKPWSERLNDHRFLPFNLNLVYKSYAEDPAFHLDVPTDDTRRHPGMRPTSFRFRGGNFVVRHALSAYSLRRPHFARFNGFQEVTKATSRGDGERWFSFSTTTRFHQTIGEVDPLPEWLRGAFDPAGYGHFALSGKPYLSLLKQGNDEVVRQEPTWEVNGLSGNSFECGALGVPELCFPKQTRVTKTVHEATEVFPRPSRVDYEYDALGNITAERHYDMAGGRFLSLETTYRRESEFGILKIRDRPETQIKKGSDGTVLRKKDFEYDARGNPTREVMYVTADGSRTLSLTRHFDTNGNMDSLTDIDGVTKTIGYNRDEDFPARANLFPNTESVTIPGGATLTTTRDFDRLTGEVEREVDSRGVGKKIDRDGFGRPVREYVIAASGTRTLVRSHNYQYQTISLDGTEMVLLRHESRRFLPDYPLLVAPSEITYGTTSGSVFQKCILSERGNYRLVQFRIRNGGREEVQTEPVFADNCNFLSSLTPGVRTYRKVQDLLGRVILSEPPSGDTASPVGSVEVSYSTDISGHIVKTTTDSLRRTTVEYYDDQERLIETRDPAGSAMRYSYNAVGDLLSVSDGTGTLTTISYDLMGRKTEMTDADMGRWQYRYDDRGRLSEQIDARGSVARFTYDGLGRVTQKEYRDGSGRAERTEVSTYDRGEAGYDVRPGELFQVEERDGSGTRLRRTRFSYDPAYRRTARLSRLIPGVGEFHQTLNYDYLGRATETSYPGGHRLLYRYMPNSNLMRICGNSCDTRGGGLLLAGSLERF